MLANKMTKNASTMLLEEVGEAKGRTMELEIQDNLVPRMVTQVR